MIGASGVPMLTSKIAGKVMTAAITAISMTPLAGTRVADSADHRLDPGTAPSRLNANSIREADVMQEVAQNSCPAAEMNRTNDAQFLSMALRKMNWMGLLAPPTPALSGCPLAAFGTANTTHSTRM